MSKKNLEQFFNSMHISPLLKSSFSIRPVGGSSPGAQPVARNQGGYYSRYPALQPATKTLTRVEAEQYKNTGNEFRKLKLYPEAVRAYYSAIQLDPYYTDAYFNMAQLMLMAGQNQWALYLMTQLLFITPDDHDARVVLGEYWEKAGNTQEAKKRYLEVLKVKPDFDPAKRRLNYLLYLDQKRFLPDTADALLNSQYQEVVHKGRELLKEYFTIHHPNPVLLKLSQEIPVVFEETQKIDEISNIAEYDNSRGVIRLQPQMLFSTHNVVASYIVHELIHALDEDSKTSVLEEQDGYRELARFWGIYQGAENDPNLDKALALYKKSPDSLDQEVRRVYTIRDPDMPDKSPGHGLYPTSFKARESYAYETSTKAPLGKQLYKTFQAR